jgi:hypothetical protein
MPTLVWLSLTARLSARTAANGGALADARQPVSPDRLTRRRQAAWAGPLRLERACRPLFVWERGALLLDETGMPQPVATAMAGLAWVFSSPERTPVSGFALVLLGWTKGPWRIPRGLRRWHQGGPAKDALALAGLSDARHRRRCRPGSVLFDAWSPSKPLLKRLRHDGWDVVCRLQKNRRWNGRPLRADRRHPSGAESGGRRGGLTVLVVRHGKQDEATNRLMRPAAEVRRWSRLRAPRADVIRVCKDPLGLTGGQARSERAQRPHLACCLVACCVLEREPQERHLSLYTLKRQRRFQGHSMGLPALERLRRAA